MPVFRLLIGLLTSLLLVGAVGPGRAQVATPLKKIKAHTKRTAPAPPSPDAVAAHDADSLVALARTLEGKYQEAEALEKCRLALRFAPTHLDALCRASMLSSRLGGRFTDETRRAAYYEQAQGYAARAVDAFPQAATANYALALAITNVGSLAGPRGRFNARLDARPYLENALEADPRYAPAWQLMGRWQFKVANYNFFERLGSQLLTGSVPRGATNAKAVAALRRAIAYDSTHLDYHYDLARMYALRRRYPEAMEVLARAQIIDPVTAEELAVSRQCAALLEQLRRRRKLTLPELGR